jgi:DHA3 family tetracycline resistance protein-like MFS transporter
MALVDRIQLLRPLRHRDFGLLWAGMSISILGDGFYQVALAWQVYLLSDAPTALSIVGAAVTLPHVLFQLLAGVLSDRFDRRKICIVADALRAVAVGTMGILAIAQVLELWHVVVLSALFGIGEALFGPAFTALVPDLVPKDELPQANSVDSFVRPLGLNFLGPALGGILIGAIGSGATLVLDGLSFAVSIVAFALMRPRPMARGEHTVKAALDDLREGFAYVRRHTWIWGTLVAALISLLCFMGPLRVLVPYVVKNHLGGSATDLGLVFAAGGVGSIVTSIAFSQYGLPKQAVVVMFSSWGLGVFLVGGFGLVTTLWQAAAISLIISSLAAMGQLIWATLVGTRVPRELLGRVSSVDWMLSIGLVPVSFIATGPLAEAIGVSQTLILAGVFGGAAFIGFMFLPGMRDPHPGAEPIRAR